MSSAEIYMTRFLLKASIKEVNIYLLVATCIYVACKIEEYPQHIRTILAEARRCWPEFIPNDLTKLAELEFYLIDELDCYLIVYHPYNSLMQIVNVLQDTHDPSLKVEITPDELQAAWSIINDSYILDLHMMFAPHIIAVAALYLTLLLGVDLGSVEGSNSQASFVQSGSRPELIKAKNEIAVSPSAFNSPNSKQSPVAHMAQHISNHIKVHSTKHDSQGNPGLISRKSPPSPKLRVGYDCPLNLTGEVYTDNLIKRSENYNEEPPASVLYIYYSLLSDIFVLAFFLAGSSSYISDGTRQTAGKTNHTNRHNEFRVCQICFLLSVAKKWRERKEKMHHRDSCK